jgi:hypothetical protein
MPRLKRPSRGPPTMPNTDNAASLQKTLYICTDLECTSTH